MFLTTDIALRIFSWLFATSFAAEHSFSALNRIKDHLRSIISEEKLHNLALVPFVAETETVNALNFDSLIDTLSYFKARRKSF